MALTAFGALLMLLPQVAVASIGHAFSPMLALALWREEPDVVAAAPLLSQFASAGIFGAAFNAVLLLISGRHVERALGGVGIVVAFVAGAYGGALARLVLTPGSGLPGLGAAGGLFAVIGAYLMLYGIPAGLPLNLRGSRATQVAALALIWAAVQFVFLLAVGGGDLSVSIVEPLGGLLAGAALARLLLRWRYRGA